MERPELIAPPDGALFALREMARFRWSLVAPEAGAAATKIALYIGSDQTRPYASSHVVKTWISLPGDPWERFNETIEALGLQAGETYYWQVAQQLPGQGMVPSSVRRFHVVSREALRKLRVSVYFPRRLRPGRPFRVRLHIDNRSDEAVRLTFPGGRVVDLTVFQTRGILKDVRVWTNSETPEELQPMEIPPGSGRDHVEIWEPRRSGKTLSPGRYRLHVRFLAEQYATEADYGFTIV